MNIHSLNATRKLVIFPPAHPPYLDKPSGHARLSDGQNGVRVGEHFEGIAVHAKRDCVDGSHAAQRGAHAFVQATGLVKKQWLVYIEKCRNIV